MNHRIPQELARHLSQEDIHWGIAHTFPSEFSARFELALIVAIPHKRILHLGNYREGLLNHQIQMCRDRCTEILAEISSSFGAAGIPHHVPQAAQRNELDLEAEFSFKDAAVNAGLGWIGKNDLLITEKYGPRVRLTAVLFHCRDSLPNSVAPRRCPDGCTTCVSACPHHLLTGRHREVGMRRDAFIDYRTCNVQRSKFIKTLGRKHACGLCLVSCPIGQHHNQEFAQG